VVRKKLCIRCGDCAKACPVDAIYLDASVEPFVCIHCGKCVPYCPHDCLEHTEFSRGAADARKEAADKGEVES
jgi:formate hydrogenlyase subunit 6/NADH:ubiquinone oxidoreductase subunit I